MTIKQRPWHFQEDEEFYVIGDRVRVDGQRAGSVAYFGETEFAPGGDWVGVVLDEPTGQHDGKVHGREYFQCAPNHGTFVRTHRVALMAPTARAPAGGRRLRELQNGVGSRTPTPTYNQLLRGGGGAGGGEGRARAARGPAAVGREANSSSRCSSANSPLDLYYYDEDYRRERTPTIALLEQKLKSIEEEAAAPYRASRPGSRCWLSPSDTSSGLGSSQRDLTSASSSTTMGSRLNELSQRLRASSASPAPERRPVFAFRPKREPWAGATSAASIGQALPSGERRHASFGGPDNGLPTLEASAARGRSVDLSNEPPRVGERVLVRAERHQRELMGVLRFTGATEFATGEWAGVELDAPVGKSDGSILGRRYFYCDADRGLFVPAARVRKCNARATGGSLSRAPNSALFDSMRSTITSPPPPIRRHYAAGSSLSTTPSSRSELSPYASASPSSQTSLSIERPLNQARSYDALCGPTYVSRGTSVSPPPLSSSARTSLSKRPEFAQSRAKFDDRDFERELNKALSAGPSTLRQSYSRPAGRAKAVTYTFITNKYDGNPIAKRTLVYE